MITGVRARPGTKDSSITEVTREIAALGGEVVVLRKVSNGYAIELAHPGCVGKGIIGYFIPVSQYRSKSAEPVRGVITEIDQGTSERQSVSACASQHMEDPQDKEIRRWKAIREKFLQDYRSVTAPELAELTGSRSRNPSSRAHEWLRAGKMFAVYDGRLARYPLFQIDQMNGTPRPQIKDAIAYLRKQLSDWQIAFWFVTANAWTGDWRCPVDLLETEPERVVEAARHEVEEQVL